MSSWQPVKIKAEADKYEKKAIRLNGEHIKFFESNPSPKTPPKSRAADDVDLLHSEGGHGLNCAFYKAAFQHADLRVSLPEVRPKFRDVSVNARQTSGDLPERTLPSSEVGPRQSETPSRHRRGNYFQRVGLLQHRLPEQVLPGSGQKRITDERGRREICFWERIENAGREEIDIGASD